MKSLTGNLNPLWVIPSIGTITMTIAIAPFASNAIAQSIAPANDGTGTQVKNNGASFDISGGSLSQDGANLFHSFQRFGLSQGQIANFLSNPAIRNILGRVTGGEASYINGLIQVTGGNSNLFLMNPAGIVFGQNASLNVPAAFTATTATGIGFNAGWFNAVGSNDYAALVGEPNAFILSQPGAIVNEGNLTLQPGNNLNLIGGTVINTGTLTSSGGNITIAAVAGENTVRISQSGHLLSLEVEAGIGGLGDNETIPFGIASLHAPISLPQLLTGGNAMDATSLSVNENGEVFLTNSGEKIPTEAGSAIALGTIDSSSTSSNGGAITINATADIVAGNLTTSAGGEGDGGAIAITSTNGSIDTSSGKLFSYSPRGNAGAVSLTATGDIKTGDISSPSDSGSGGAIAITSTNGSIDTSSGDLYSSSGNLSSFSDRGNGGDINLAATGDIKTSNISSYSGGSGSGGAIAITTTNGGIDTSSGQISSYSFQGNGGDVSLTATGDIKTSHISSHSNSSSTGGNIEVNSTQGSVDTTSGRLFSSSVSGSGGNVALTAKDMLNVGDISSSGLLQGGNITLTSNSSNVSTTSGTLDASSGQGNPGKIAITANGGSIVFGNVSDRNITVADGGSDDISIANPDAEVTFDADKINPLKGEVSLQAHNDITVNEPISTSSISLLELKAGRNININANIDTSGSNGNITLRGNDSGADINRRSPGAGNVTMAPGTTIDAGTGNIIIELGTLAEVGNIAIANLNTTGNVSVNARAGNILRSSDNALITANSAVFQTMDTGGVGTPSQPLRLNVNNLEATTGYSGAFFDSPNKGVTVGGADSSFNGISTSGGGDITLTAFGDIIITEPLETSAFGNAGNIALTSSKGAIDATSSSLQSYSNQGNGGAVSLMATGDIKTSNIFSDSNGSGNGGAIAITSTNGSIDTSSGELYSYSYLGNAGAVSLTATRDIKTSNIICSCAGYSGNGGAIAITSTNGGIDTSSGGLFSFSYQGNGGAVSLAATEDIKTSNISSHSGGSGSGGNITLTSSSGNITSLKNADFSFFQNALESFSDLGIAGDVTVSAAGNVTIESIRSDGDGKGGNINISSGNAINTTAGDINSYSEKGIGGDVTLVAQNDVTANNISTYGQLESGNVTIISSFGGITTSAITTQSPNGTSGNIALNTFTTTGNITTTDIASSGYSNSGNIIIDSAGNVTTSDVSSTSSNGASGDAIVNADGDATTGEVTSTGNTSAGDAAVTAGGNASTGNVSSTSSAGTSGNATVIAGENATTGDVTSTGNTGAGNAFVTANSIATTGNISSISSAGTSGNAAVIAGVNAAVGDVTSSGNTGAGTASVTTGRNATIGNVSSISKAGTSGNASVTASGNVTTGNVSSIGQTGAGNAIINAGESAQIGNVLSQSQLGTSGNAIVNAAGNLQVGNILSIGNTGAGDVLVTSSTGSINAGNLESISQAGNSGNISVAARGDITAANIRSQGNTEAGNIAVNSTEGAVTTGNLESLAEKGNAGDINVDAFRDVTTGDISSIGGLNSGDITVTSREGAIATGNIQTIALTGVAGDINLSAKNGITIGNLISLGALENGSINLNNSTGKINTGEAIVPDRTVMFNSPIAEEINPQQVSAALNIPNNLPNTNVISAIAPNSLIEEIELTRSQEFSDYLGEDIQAQPMNVESVKNALSTIAEQTGIRSAIVYVTAHPEQLEMVLFTAEGEPVRKTIPAANRETVLKFAKEFRDRITDPRERNTSSYLKSSQQLYQWLIAPIESELQDKNITNLLFSMDAGLRSLPLAALHDGKQFLVEKYSLALIPSVSLMDTRYQSLQNHPILAMGASKFIDSQPLPAVPYELEAIAREGSGKTFLNEDFTIENLKNQRSNYPYKIIHLATHAEFQPGVISNSYIQLWNDNLRFDRLRELKLNNPSVELLVLSACRTAVGDEKAEMGFAGLAVLSGVKSALASLWYVSDVGTLALMNEFYDRLKSAPIKAEALRRSQLAMIRGEVRLEKGQLHFTDKQPNLALPPDIANIDSLNLSHPYYWSGFTTIGSPW